MRTFALALLALGPVAACSSSSSPIQDLATPNDLAMKPADLSTTSSPDLAAAPDLASGAKPDLATSGGNTVTVQVGLNGMVFAPSTVTLKVGDTVHWVWAASGHNVVSGTNGTADGKFCSPTDTGCSTTPTSAAGATYDHKFTAAGTYPYFCRPHSPGMSGTITVQ